jgi:diadenosine tetraphosphate (Ap4A) HIT family hydrolase
MPLQPPGRRAATNPPPPTTTSTTTTPPQRGVTSTGRTTPVPGTIQPATDGMDATPAFRAEHDLRYRAGVTAVTAGATTTAVPNLLADWKEALVDAAAQQSADAELEPVVQRALKDARDQKGDDLTRGEARMVRQGVRKLHQPQLRAAKSAYLAEYTKSPQARQKTERDVVLAERPYIAGLREPFGDVAANRQGARDDEIVLWENQNAMVLVDTFAPVPKALVVPKQSVMLPLDAPPGLLEELALIAAHASDAFASALGTPPAGIWVNPPQHLSVQQLHVHVLPKGNGYTDEGHSARDLLGDPAARQQIEAMFAGVGQALEQRLGKTQTPAVVP